MKKQLKKFFEKIKQAIDFRKNTKKSENAMNSEIEENTPNVDEEISKEEQEYREFLRVTVKAGLEDIENESDTSFNWRWNSCYYFYLVKLGVEGAIKKADEEIGPYRGEQKKHLRETDNGER